MESESKSYLDSKGDNQLQNNEQHESKDRVETLKEDESKTLKNQDFISTGQNFFQAADDQKNFLKFEEEKQEDDPTVQGERTMLNKINQMDSIFPGINNQYTKIRQEDLL